MTKTEISNLALSRLGARRVVDVDADTTPEARSCALHFNVVRDDLLRRHHWNFALARKTYVPQGAAWSGTAVYAPGDVASKDGSNFRCVLGHAGSVAVAEPVAGASRLTYWTAAYAYDVSSSPQAEWEAAWTLPVDLVRFTRVAGATVDEAVNDFAIEGRSLLVNGSEGPSIVYVSNAVEMGKWDGLFVQAMSYALAHEIALDVTQNAGLAQQMQQGLERLALPEAKLADARETRSGENFGTSHMVGQSGLVRSRFR
ncbi:hypothetical protein [Luteolibacter sp. LG18]|uniref:hypothetical protein n=1 Tax=Luteolibacter sp. LG18 TaxID=2819286 RepID=UPI0030C74380